MITIIANWLTFQKARKPGWACIVPIYNLIVVSQIVWGNGGTIFLMLVPFYNIYFAFKHQIALAHAFGKSTGYGVGMAFFPFLLWGIAYFSDVRYLGPQAAHAKA